MHPYHPKVTITSDGSNSLYVPSLDEHYHSHHGAVQEANHVFIKHGLKFMLESGTSQCRVFEVGFGTGLNALLTALYVQNLACEVNYTAVELYPVEPQQALSLNYPVLIDEANAHSIFTALHQSKWNEPIALHAHFSITKVNADMMNFQAPDSSFDLIFFDAFGYRAQSELWSDQVFQCCYDMLCPGGYLTTYASKGIIRRSMQAAGFLVEKLPGPPGKREMVRAQKPI